MNEEQKCGYSVEAFIGNTRFTRFCKLPWDHSGVHEFPKFTGEEMMKPLSPTAEQTSIARFNALANEIRTNHEFIVGVMGSFENRIMEHLSHASQMEIATRESLDRMAETQQRYYENILRLTAIQWDSLSKAIKPRAVAKKKAATLVGKKGPGRKG